MFFHELKRWGVRLPANTEEACNADVLSRTLVCLALRSAPVPHTSCRHPISAVSALSYSRKQRQGDEPFKGMRSTLIALLGTAVARAQVNDP
eukprot:6481697-Amphidinium_carterae.1